MLEVRDLKKYYKTKGGVEVHALDGVSIQFPETGMVFLLGKSGSGKSTLLNVSGGLDRPDSGEVIVKGKSSLDFSQSDFDSYRNTFIGFIFQEYNILNEFNVETNIALALELQGKKNDKQAVNDLLKQVDLEGLGKRKPNTLSGGQKQRIAIARALIKNPEIIMADEPTGALDSNTGKQVLDTLKKLSETKLVIIVSHDRDFAEEYGDRIIELKDGKVLSDHSKDFAKAQDLTTNIRKIGEGTIQIKDVEKLSDADLRTVISSLKGKGEVIISNNENNVTTFKKVAKISDDGAQQYFKDTELDKVNIKSYDGKQTKFIKSRLPGKHALKMGASNLKIKPGRLIFTIFLSIIAFSMFGILSTLMLYNPAYTYSKGIQQEVYDSLTMEKKYNAHVEGLRIDKDGKETVEHEYDSDYDTSISKNDIQKLNQNGYGLDFAGVYKKEVSYQSHLKEMPSLPYYNQINFYGICDCGEEYLLRQNGFRKIAGHYPTNENEIAISDYVYEIFKKQGYCDPANNSNKEIRTEDDLIGCKINTTMSNPMKGNSKTYNFTIVGIYHTDNALSNPKYDVLKEQDHSSVSNDEYDSIKTSYSDVHDCSFAGLLYVSTDFYDNNKPYLQSATYNYIYLNATNFYGMRLLSGSEYAWYKKDPNSGNYIPGEYEAFYGLTASQAKGYKQYLTYYDLQGNVINDTPQIGMDEVYVCFNSYNFARYAQSVANYSAGYKSGRYTREGVLEYYTPYDSYTNVIPYIDLITKEIYPDHLAPAGAIPVTEAIVGGDTNNNKYPEAVAYKRDAYLNDDGTSAVLTFDSTHKNYTYEAWFDANDNYIGNGYNTLQKIELRTFYYSSETKKAYSGEDVDKVGSRFVLKTNHDITVTEINRSYVLDSEGNPVEPNYDQTPRIGLYLNPTTRELTLNKTANSVYTDSYYIDTNNNIYIGTFISSNLNAVYTKDNDFVCFLDYDNGEFGYVNARYEINKQIYYLEGDNESLIALAKYLTMSKQGYIVDDMKRNYPSIDFDSYVDQPFTNQDMKKVISVLNRYKADFGDKNDDANYDADMGIITKSGADYSLKLKGYFVVDDSVNGDTNLIVNDGWTNRIQYPENYYVNEYTWKENIVTKYTVDSTAQYARAISLCDKSTEQLTFMTQMYEDDSFYFLDNSIFQAVYFLTDTLMEMKTVFLIVGIVMASFSGLMLLNFISTSISAKQKEIGILRAVGARGSDVFKIYFSEAGIISLICIALASILSPVACYFLNAEMARGLNIEVFNFGLMNIGIIFAVAIVVGLIGTLLPVIRASKRPPVESIRAL